MAKHLNYLNRLYEKYLYYFFKWLVRLFCRKSAVSRLLTGKTFINKKMILELEKYLSKSKTKDLNGLVDCFSADSSSMKTYTDLLPSMKNALREEREKLLDDGMGIEDEESLIEFYVTQISTIKQITQIGELTNLRLCCEKIVQYRLLIREVEKERTVAFSSGNPEHEKMLVQLWSNLMGGNDDTNERGENAEVFERISKNWDKIGFQGKDPATDFRGMGVLGLKNLLFISGDEFGHKNLCRSIHSQSLNPKNGYSFAITVIDITSMVYQFLVFGALKQYFYDDASLSMTLTSFQEVFVSIFKEFNKFYFDANPSSIMEYQTIRNSFKDDIQEKILCGKFEVVNSEC